MAKAQINSVTNANIYLDGQNFLGRCEKVTLPTISRKMDDHKGLGMASEIELPTRGIEKMESKFLWSSFYPDVIKATADPTKIVLLQVRSVIDQYTGAGLSGELPLIISLGGIFKGRPLGEFEKQKRVTLEDVMTTYYVKVIADGEELIEIDVLNNIDKVAGGDLLSRFRGIIGA